MLDLYGSDWAVMAATADVAEVEPEEVPMTAGTLPASAKSLEPSAAASAPATAASAVGGMATPRRAQEISPGSGQAGGTASPGSGMQSPASWTSRSPGTPITLRQKIFKDYSPETELLETYVARIQRQAAALTTLGEPLEEGHLEAVLAKAQIELRLFEEAPGNPARQARILAREYVFELLEITGTEAQAGRLYTLEAMLAARGENVEDIKTKAAAGQPVAITPVQAAPSPLVLGPKRGSAPSLEPAAPAGFQKFNIFGQGADTPTGRPPVDAELEKIRRQLRERTSQLENKELELAAHLLGSGLPSGAQTPNPQFADILKQQADILEKLTTKPKHTPSSTIRVEPKVQWPRLGDDGPGGKEVLEFYEKFEEITGLANNGTGMSDREMLVALKTCVHGSRRKIFDNVAKSKRDIQDTDEGPGEIYRAVKARLFHFLETSTEKQLRVRSEWYNLSKTRGRTSLQFEAE